MFFSWKNLPVKTAEFTWKDFLNELLSYPFKMKWKLEIRYKQVNLGKFHLKYCELKEVSVA